MVKEKKAQNQARDWHKMAKQGERAPTLKLFVNIVFRIFSEKKVFENISVWGYLWWKTLAEKT